ncbi:hypothetical protein AeNC1_016048, partial [Aphanomyces euteiches]
MASNLQDAAIPITPKDTDYVEKDADGLDVVDKSQQEGMSIPMMFLVCCPKMAMNMAWAAQWAAFGPLLQVLLSTRQSKVCKLSAPPPVFLSLLSLVCSPIPRPA